VNCSLLIEETMKAHIQMTSVYNGYTMKAGIQSQFTMDMFNRAVLTCT
jgi:hypothetical protein